MKWFLPSNSLEIANFIGYLEVAITPIITERLAEKSEKLRDSLKIELTTTKATILGAGLFAITLISTLLFWIAPTYFSTITSFLLLLTP